MAQTNKRKGSTEDENRPSKAQKPNTKTENTVNVTKSTNSAIPNHQQVLEGFLLIGLETDDVEHLLQFAHKHGLRFPRSSRTSTASQILRRIQERFASLYNATAISDEVRRLNPQAPKPRGRWNAMNALARWDQQAEQDIERARRLGVTDRGPLLMSSAREDIQRRLNEETEAFRSICYDRGYEEPRDLAHALDLIEMPILAESIRALSLPVPTDVNHARELLQDWDDESKKDLQGLGLDLGLLDRGSRLQVQRHIAEADGPLRARAITRGYDVGTSTKAHEIVKMLTTSIIGENDQALVEACERIGLKVDRNPCDLRKRLLDHEHGIFTMQCLGEPNRRHPLDALNVLTNPSPESGPQGVPPRAQMTQTTQPSHEASQPSLGSITAGSENEPSPESEYLHGLGDEPNSIYQQVRSQDGPEEPGSLFRAFAVAFFNDPDKWNDVQKEAEKIFNLAVYCPSKSKTGYRNYVRCVRYDWYRELNQKAASDGNPNLTVQLRRGQDCSVETIQLLVDMYHVQIVVHFITEDHRWSLIARGPSQLEGARAQIHLIYWRGEKTWIAARRVNPKDTWLLSFPNYPLSIMPLIPAPVFTDGIRPVPLLRDLKLNCPEDYETEIDDHYPPSNPESCESRSGSYEENEDAEEEGEEDAGEGNSEVIRWTVGNWAANVPAAIVEESRRSDENVNDGVANVGNDDTELRGKIHLGSSNDLDDIDPQQRMDLERLPRTTEDEASLEVRKEDNFEKGEAENTHEEKRTCEKQASTSQFSKGTDSKLAAVDRDIHEKHTNEELHRTSVDQAYPVEEQSSVLYPQRLTTDSLNSLTPSRSQIPGLSLLGDANKADISIQHIGHHSSVVSRSHEPSEDDLFAEMRQSQALLAEEPNSQRNPLQATPDDLSPDSRLHTQAQRPPVTDEATFDQGAVYLQGQRIPLYDEDGPESDGEGAVHL